MGLESCMLLLDNSEYMRNGDFAPTRFQAQAQAVNTVFTSKTGSNPESAVGLMTMAGKAPQLLATPTGDIGKLLSALARAEIGGTSDLATSVQIAQLALKHRENKNQRQRIVVFVGSPLNDTAESLAKLGQKLRKNNVVIDVVTFGDEGQAEDSKMEALVKAAGKDDCNLVSVPAGPHLLGDVIASSAILFDPEMAGASGGAGGDGDDHPMGDLDPNMDPELAMAIRMSLQEAAERTQREQAASGSAPAATEPATAPTSSSVPAPVAPSTEAAETTPLLPQTMTEPLTNANDTSMDMAPGDGDDEDDELLQQALAMSRGDQGGDVEMEDDDEEEDEEAAIARAIEMSLQNDKAGEEKK